jgi:endonuclease YncB( thermonuclease family)
MDVAEPDRPCDPQARLLINSLVDRRRVEVKPTGELSYGRTVADIVLPSGRDVAMTLVVSGAAWVERSWDHDPAAYAAQGNAQRSHLGLWIMPLPPCRTGSGRSTRARDVRRAQRLAGALGVDALRLRLGQRQSQPEPGGCASQLGARLPPRSS